VIRVYRPHFKRPPTLPGLLLAVIMAGVVGLGPWASQRGTALADDGRKSTGHAVSERRWAAEQEIKVRYSASKHREFMRKAIANSRTAGV